MGQGANQPLMLTPINTTPNPLAAERQLMTGGGGGPTPSLGSVPTPPQVTFSEHEVRDVHVCTRIMAGGVVSTRARSLVCMREHS